MLERLLHPREHPVVRRCIIAALAMAALMTLVQVALQWSVISIDLLMVACMAVPIAIGCVDLACALAATTLAAAILVLGPWSDVPHEKGVLVRNLLALASLIILPVCLAVRDGGSGERRLRALAQATGLACLSLQWALALLLPIWHGRWWLAWGECLLMAGVLIPVAAVLPAQRQLVGTGRAQPLPLPPLVRPPSPHARALVGWLAWLLAALIALSALKNPDVASSIGRVPLTVIALQCLTWLLATGVWRFLLVPVLAGIACFGTAVSVDGLHQDVLLLVVQMPALAWWWRRAVGSAMPWYPLPLWCLALLIASLPPSQLARPILTMAGLVALVELALARFPDGIPSPRTAFAAARGRLSPFWIWYLPLKSRLDPVFGALRNDPRPWGEVLDLGCGPGITAAIARVRPGTTGYCGIDLDLEKLEVARTLLDVMGCPLGAHWQLFNGRMPFPQPLPARFDTVLLLDVLHYWPSADQDALLRWARAGARAGAELLLRDGAAEADGGAGAVEQGERFTTAIGLNPRVERLHFRTLDELAGALAASGWSVVVREPCGSRNWLWRCRAVEAAAAIAAASA